MNVKKENEGEKQQTKIKKQNHAHRKCSKYIHASDLMIHDDSHKEATNMTFQATPSSLLTIAWTQEEYEI